MQSALYYVFKKNRWLLFAVLIMFLFMKGLAFNQLHRARQQNNLSSKQEEQLAYRDIETINGLIEFAQNKEGILPTVLPANYMELQDFYKNLQRPQAIQQSLLVGYFELQEGSIVIFVITLLMIVIWGTHYELEIYKYAIVTPKGKDYHKTIRRAMFAISYFFLFADEILDLLYSGILRNPQIFSASVQSYREFIHAQDNMNLAMSFAIMWISKIMTVFILGTAFELIARRKKSVKDTAVNAVCLLLLVGFLKKGMVNTEYFSIIQIGIVDWKKTIDQSQQIVGLNVSTLILGVVFSCILGLCTQIISCIEHKNFSAKVNSKNHQIKILLK